jgi:hypothetical protein
VADSNPPGTLGSNPYYDPPAAVHLMQPLAFRRKYRS